MAERPLFSTKRQAGRWNRPHGAAFGSRMTMPVDGPYFASRELDEQTLSREAIDWRVAAAHAELAARYEALAAVFGAKRLTSLPIDYPSDD